MEKYKDYTAGLALFDFVPVTLFLANGVALGRRMGSRIFILSAVCCFLGGLCKASWKLILVTKKKDLKVLTKLFHIFMPAGFLACAVTAVVSALKASRGDVRAAFFAFPAVLFFCVGICGMCAMVYYSVHMDKSAKSNWIEEMTNAAAQTAFLIGLLLS